MSHLNRRLFIKMAASGIAAASFSPLSTAEVIPGAYKAVAFDAFPIFDPRPIFKLVKNLYPEKGDQFAVLWRTRIFEYTWLRVSANQYKDFWGCINDALIFTTKQLKINLTEENQQQLMQAFLNLKPYPDVLPALKIMKAKGLRLAFLSNMTSDMLMTNIKRSGLEAYFDYVISTDEAKTFKPNPLAYQLGIDTLGFKKEEIVFAAFASWDAIGAKWFGYPTVWVNRLNFTPEVLGENPDHTGTELDVLLKIVT